MADPFENQQTIKGIKNIIAIGSGKGGVGKSTVSVNLAAALAKRGLKVGLLDADLYGPSIPRMLGALHQRPEISQQEKLIPIERFNIRLMSIGFMVEEDAAVIWRGPMLFKALTQFLHDVDWGELDVLLIDLPPGTGDVPLTIAQKTPLTGAIAVSTPQNVALADARKAVDMFKKLSIPVLGLIENMSYLRTPGDEDKRIQLFPKGDLDKFLSEQNIDKLAELPFIPNIGLSSETGIPFVENNNADTEIFLALADKVKQRLTH